MLQVVPADICARLIGQWLSERLGQAFIIENRTGAGGNIATEMVVRAKSDGYTLLEATPSNAWNAALYNNLAFDFIRDIAPVALIGREGGVMVVHPTIPIKTVPEFIAYAKSNSGKVNIGTGGVGSPSHLYGTSFKTATGIDLVECHFAVGAGDCGSSERPSAGFHWPHGCFDRADQVEQTSPSGGNHRITLGYFARRLAYQ
jgi:tripartite-type tricarboxylate transporter receptor subunit TctC